MHRDTSSATRILLAEDSDRDAELVLHELKRAGVKFDSRRVQTEADFRRALDEFRPQLILSDYVMPGFSGLAALRVCREAGIDIPFIFVSGTIGEDVAVESMKAGADDYVMKTNLVRLGPTVVRALREAGLRQGGKVTEAALLRAQTMARLAHIVAGSDGSFESWSETMPQMIGLDPAAMPKNTREWLDLVHPEDRAGVRAKFIEAAQTGLRVEFEYRLKRADGSWMDIDQSSEALMDASVVSGKLRWFGTLQDVTERKRAESVLALEHGVSRKLAGADSAGEGLQAAMRLVCESEGWDFGRYWRVDQAAGVLRFADAWSMPGDDGSGVTEASREVTFAPGVGLAGKVWQSGEPLWVSNVSEDARVLRQHFARTAGMRGVFVFPVVAEGTIVGVLAFSSREIREPDKRLLAAVREIGGQIGQFLRRKEADERIKRLSRVHAVLSGINALIVRVQDRDELFREACRIAIEAGSFSAAWMGVLDRATMGMVPAASHGVTDGYIGEIRRSLNRVRSGGGGIAGQAIRDKQPVISNDVARDPRMRIAEQALALGTRALAVLPCIVAGNLVAVLSLHAREVDFFDDEEMKLLQELAGNIAFAIGNLDKADRLQIEAAERTRAESRVARLNRVYAVLSGIDAIIVRVHDRAELFREACRIAVEVGGLPLAWIGMVDEEKKQLRPVAWQGTGPDYSSYIGMMRLGIDDAVPEGRGMAGRAVRDRKPVIANDIAHDERITMKKDAEERGFRSLAILPLIIGKRVVGTMALYVGEVGFFDEEEMKLLQGLAGDIAFALDNLERAERLEIETVERARAEAKVVRLSRVHAVLSGINALIVRVRERDELFKEACRIAVEQGGFKMAWIGIVDSAAQKIVPIASAGAEPEFLTLIQDRFTLREDAPHGNTKSARAVREKNAMVSNDIKDDEQVLFAKERQERGIRSMAILPLLVSDNAVGVLALYAGEAGFFDDDELKLLHELAGDIAFAIDHIEKAGRLDYLAFYDQLTGLANRTLFLERVNQLIIAASQAETKFALAILDIERLRTINDSLGRQAGDALIKLVAERLTLAAGPAGVSRISADHFALVLGTVKGRSEAARIMAGALRKCFDAPFQVKDTEVRISAKAGVAQFPGDATEAETLLRNAEAALRRGKEGGERITFHSAEMTSRIAESLTLENKLRQALEKEEFVLHYQPKVDLDTRRIVGVEALIRWQSPERGLVPPMQFIPLLEETGLIVQVGAWALKRATRDHALWLQQGLTAPRIAVNISAIQLRQRDFVQLVTQAISGGTNPTSIDIEITESQLMEDVAGNIEKLKALRDLGMKISIDDFGTGYSSLGYLASLPVHILKIDRSFIVAMMKNPDTMTLVSTIISLAHSLRLDVVAEGVEQEDQAKMLRLLRCDQMQGYLISKPVPMDDLTPLLRDSPAVSKT